MRWFSVAAGWRYAAPLLIALGATPLKAQAPPAVGDTVRARLPLTTLRGVVLLATPDSLIIAHTNPTYANPATLTPGMLNSLAVKVGPRSRGETVAVATLAGLGVSTLLVLFGDLTSSGGGYGKGERPRRATFSAPFFVAPVAGFLIGMMIPAERWRPSSLPAGHGD